MARRPWLLWSLPLLGACVGELGPLLSPSDGATLNAPIVPLVVTLPNSGAKRQLRVYLDGEEVSDPTEVRRRVYSFLGGEHHAISALDLSEVAPGEHELELVLGRWPNRSTLVSSFTLAPPEGTVQVRIEDERGEPAPGRVYVFDEDQALVELTSAGTAVDHKGRDVDQNAIFCPDGSGMAWLEPGTYTLVGWRGLRADLDVQTVTIEPGEQSLVFTVPTAFDTPGELASDLHVHTGASIDAWVPDRLRFDSLDSVGLDVYVITEHNHISDAPGRLAASRPESPASAVTGVELDVRVAKPFPETGHSAAGHLNIFPLQPDVATPDHYKDLAAEVFAEAHALGDEHGIDGAQTVVQLNHPRGIHFHPTEDPQRVWQFWDALGYDHGFPPGEGDNEWMSVEHEGVDALDFTVLEVVNRFSVPLYVQVRQDWFHLLDHGYYRTATGNSDTHGLTVELAGMTLTMVEAGLDETGEADLSEWTRSLAEGRARVTTGPFVSLSIDGASSGEMVATNAGSTAEIRVQAAAWVPLDRVRLVVGSEIIWWSPIREADREADGRLDLTFSVPIPELEADTWAVAEAGYAMGSEPPAETLGWYAKIAPGYVPLGFTNAIKLDADDDGRWHGN